MQQKTMAKKMLWSSTLGLILQCASLSGAGITWTEPADISRPGREAAQPRVTFAPHGNASVIWSRHTGAINIIQTATSKIGGAWSPPYRLTKQAYEAGEAKIATDAMSNTVAIWSRFNGKNIAIQSAYKQTGKMWSDPVYLSSCGPPDCDAANPQIAINLSGKAVAVWQKNTLFGREVQFSQKGFGRPWTKPMTLSARGESYQNSDPQVALDDAGNAIVAWSNDTTGRIQTVQVTTDGLFTVPLNISKIGLAAHHPQIAFDGSGNLLAVWTVCEGDYHVVQSSCRNAKGIWREPVDISSRHSNAISPRLAMNREGIALAVWESEERSGSIIHIARGTSTGKWSAPEAITDQNRFSCAPQGVVDHQGRAMVVFSCREDENSWIECQDLKVDGSDRILPKVISDPARFCSAPEIALNERGDAAVVWLKFDGSNNIVQGCFGIRDDGGLDEGNAQEPSDEPWDPNWDFGMRPWH